MASTNQMRHQGPKPSSLSQNPQQQLQTQPSTPKLPYRSPPPPTCPPNPSAPRLQQQQKQQQRPQSALVTSSSSNWLASDTPTPMSPPSVSKNTTPRSDPRQTRLKSVTHSPSSLGTIVVVTPGSGSVARHSTDPRSGLGILAAGLPPRPNYLASATNVRTDYSPSPSDLDSKFFYATDAPRPPPQSPPQLSSTTLRQQKRATFYHANGEDDSLPETIMTRSTGSGSLHASPPLPDSLASKFAYANPTVDVSSAHKAARSSSPGPASVVSTPGRVGARTNTTDSATPTVGYAALARPAAPVKPPSFSLTKNTVLKPASLPSRPSPTTTTVSHKAPSSRRTSVGSHKSLQANHSMSGSISESRSSSPVFSHPPSYISSASNRSSSPVRAGPILSLSPNPLCDGPVNLASLLQLSEDLEDCIDAQNHHAEGNDSLDKVASPALRSPTKASCSSDPEVSDLVANARRHRKVQDLEIRNASLEAINRTLERQMRKHQAELRRLRRLSRPSNLALASLEGTSRDVSISTADGDGALARAGMTLDDLSDDAVSELAALEEEQEAEEEDDFSISESESDADLADSDLQAPMRRRRRDEKRLRLDLAKHQEVLRDGQKINQSLRKCLGMSEELIKEARKALAYRVHESELTLGGRVLAPEEVERRNAMREEQEAEDDDIDDDDDDGRSPSDVTTLAWDGAADFVVEWKSAHEPQDRDSGIELLLVDKN